MAFYQDLSDRFDKMKENFAFDAAAIKMYL